MPEPKPKRTDWLIAVGARFRSLRKRAGKRQDGLGVSPTSIGALEKGYGAHLALVEVACRAMEVSPPEVFASFPVTPPVQGVTDSTKDGDPMNRPDAKVLVDLIPKLTDDELEHLVFRAFELRKQRGSPGKAHPARKEQL